MISSSNKFADACKSPSYRIDAAPYSSMRLDTTYKGTSGSEALGSSESLLRLLDKELMVAGRNLAMC